MTTAIKEQPKSGLAERFVAISEKIGKMFLVRVIRDGLVTMIPLLMIGGFALILQNLPIEAYKTFIGEFADGFFSTLFTAVYTATFSVMSLYMAASFSISYFTIRYPEKGADIWGVLASVCCFLILDGVADPSFSIGKLGASAVALAIASSIIASAIYDKIRGKVAGRRKTYSYGADSRMNSAVESLIPAAAVLLISALLAYLVRLTGYATVHDLINELFTLLFVGGSSSFGSGLFFVLLSSILWVFGIHGGDCLQGVSDRLFVPLLEVNREALAAGGEATEILSKPFFDCFILMGGCGSAICLLIAILVFSRNKGMRDIAKTAAFPMLFNINELIVFGLPIVYNPILCIPFVLVPVLQYLIAYGACAFGIVPLVTSEVVWTMPVLIGGYAATGSIAGSLLQIVNIAVGVAVYTPFVRLMGKVQENRETAHIKEFIEWYRANESRMTNIRLSDMKGVYGDISKKLILDLKGAIEDADFKLYYQPQYNYKGECIGVEALLRWQHSFYSNIYPPILIQLAHECDSLESLEKKILERAVSEREKIYERFGRGIKISVNVTGYTIARDSYWEYLKSLVEANPFTEGKLCIEITEQAAINFEDHLIGQFRSCHEMGIQFAIDDFSMGQTSINYLKEGLFDLLKLDGSLVTGLKNNPRCREIISSIVAMADSLKINVLAEFVETEELRAILHETGCDEYQGYLFSPAVPLEN